MAHIINYNALNEFLEQQPDDVTAIYTWYQRLAEYDLDGTESPQELETLFEAVKFLMSFSFTAAEELKEVAEQEAVQMAEKEEAWEEQKTALKEELNILRERITLSADAGDSSEAFRAQINSLREENRELEKTNRDRDREMADLRDRFESLVTRVDVLTRERDALEQHRNQMEDTIRELQRRISSKSEEVTNEWESRKLRQRNEQAVTLTKQMHAVVLQNEELREEIARVGDALEEATKVINDSAMRYSELKTLYKIAQNDLNAITEENAVMKQKLDASTSMLMTAESEAIDNEQTTAAQMKELYEANRDLRNELYTTKKELEELREIANSMNNKEKEAELEKLRAELIEATKSAQSLCGEFSKKSPADPSVGLHLKLIQLESNLQKANEKLIEQKKTIDDLEEMLVNKDDINNQLSAELERLKELKFGTARDELQKLTTQLSFRDSQIAKLTNHCTMLQIELGNYAERIQNSLPQTDQYKASSSKSSSGGNNTSKVQGTQTDTEKSLKVRFHEERHRIERQAKKRRTSSNKSDLENIEMDSESSRDHKRFGDDLWEQQTMLIVSLYSELMLIMEEQEIKEKQITEMNTLLSNGRRAMDDTKSLLKKAYEEIYNLKSKENTDIQLSTTDEKMLEIAELRRLAETIRMDGSELERRTEEVTRKLISEQIERLRLSRSNKIVRRRCNRAERAMRRARERMVLLEKNSGKRCALLQYQLDTALIELASCQNKLIHSVSIETYQKLAIRLKKEFVSDVLDGEIIDEKWQENNGFNVSNTDEKTQELEAKNTYLKKIVEVVSEQNDFWSKETEILQNENEELKKFIEEMDNENDVKNILISIEQRLLETIREQQENQRDHERADRKAREAEEKLAHDCAEWIEQRSRLTFAVRSLQCALANTRLNSLNNLSLQGIEKLRRRIQEVREKELLVNEAKEQVETLQNELQQQLVVHNATLKAREEIEKHDSIEKIERKLQAVYSSLEIQTMEVDRLKRTISTKDLKISTLNEEFNELQKENEQLIAVIANCNLLKTSPIDDEHTKKLSKTVIPVESLQNSPPIEDQSTSQEISEEDSNDSDRSVVKTILYDNSAEFEKRLTKMKEAADICIQGYKKQLLQKDEALKEFQKFVEERLSHSSRPIIEKEIVREEICVADQQTLDELRQAIGEVARLKENVEELETANRELYRKRRRSITPVHITVECQTEAQQEEERQVENEPNGRTSVKTTPSGSMQTNVTAARDKENEFDLERTKYKNEIRQLRTKLRKVEANNKELIVTCEKIRDDTLATLETGTSVMKEANDQTLLRICSELEKTRKENRTLLKTIDEQKHSIQKLNTTIGQQRSPEVELLALNERRRIESNLNSTKKKLAVAVEREKEALERLHKQERMLEQLKRCEETRQNELDRTLRKNAQLQHERDKAVKDGEEVSVLKQRLLESAEEMKKKNQEISSLSSRLKHTQNERLQLVKELDTCKKGSTIKYQKVTQTENRANDSVKNQESMAEKTNVAVAADEILMLQLKETKKQLHLAENNISELSKKLSICENERQHLADGNKMLLRKINQVNNEPSGTPCAVSVLSDKLQAKDREISQLNRE
ncbi:hypothetical protein DICVIV_00283 [Dictyocaulus viviparus]|uniref:Uncharacterized protein n=1 Tax=Dictyocaulus viviparus TaxID=29172 RepID=A0A0D8Y9L2_DICVI|nr:hypothetical protein DICVIV_00283 [Dictyocaulus viviparus]